MDEELNAPAPAPAAAPEPAPAPAPAEQQEAAPSAASAFLDSISEPPAKPADAPAAPVATPAPLAPPSEPAPAGAPAPAAAPAAAQEDDEEDDEAAQEREALEMVKSGRGQDRIRQVFSERKQLRQDVETFRSLVRETGLSAEEFAETLELARLMKSGDERGLQVALASLEQQRAQVARRLGVEVQGVDLLADQPDLAAAVAGMEMTRERAVELAKYRRQVTEQQHVQQAQRQEQEQSAQYQQLANQGAAAMEAYLATRAGEADHPAKLQAIEAYFADEKNFKTFVETYEPKQWVGVMRMMYDTMAVPRASAASSSQQPLRSRPSTLGTPRDSSLSPIDRLAQRMDSLGI